MADDLQRYSLRWNDFYANILSAFKTLKENEEFVDVTIACDGKSLTAHKVILSACSPFFRQVLKDNPCDHPIVILKDVRYQEMESLLNFMYHGEVQISQDDLTEFLRTAQSLQVKGLTDVPYQNHQPHHHNNNNNNNNNASHHHQSSNNNNNSNSQQATVERDRERGGGGNGSGGGGHIAEGRGGRCSTSPTHSSPCTTPPIMHIPEVRLDSEENHQTSDNSMGAVSAEKKLKLDLKNHEGSSPEVNNATKQPSQSSSILIQALEGTKRDDNNTSGAMEEESSPDESDMRYEEKGMDGIESSEELSAHALNDAIRFPAAAALLGFQGFLPGPSSLQNSSPSSDPNFDLLRVRATDPRPCPKCGKIYRSAHTLRTHLEDKHTICPGYRCVLCGTVAKSRNSLHSHMSRQHRGISTKDLPVLPMPAPFDPQLAAKLLAKAGLKFNAADAPGMGDKQPTKMDGGTTGSAILDTYLQFIAENSMGLAGQLYSNQQHKKNSAADIMEDNDSADEEDP